MVNSSKLKTRAFRSICGNVLFPDGRILESSLYLEKGMITAIHPGLDSNAEFKCDGIICPGMLDLQINGGWGIDFTNDSSQIHLVARKLLATGTTAFLPTIITSDFASYPKRMDEIRHAILRQQSSRSRQNDEPAFSEARILGIHLEGPYLNPQKKGAHPGELLRPIDLQEMQQWIDPSLVRIVTLSAELPNGIDAIRALKSKNIVVSLGHTAATYQQTLSFLQAGIGWATHCFNAMPPIHQREPGAIGALLESDIPVGLIVDGIHVHPNLVRLVYRLKKPGGIILITDAMAALGKPPGTYQLGGSMVIVDEKEVHLENRTLAGSVLTMDTAVRNMVTFTGCSLGEAWSMASYQPARLLGLDHIYGRIGIGCAADLVVLNGNLQPVLTILAGKVV